MSLDRSKLRKAEKLVAQGKLKPAVDAYLKALRNDPDDPTVNNIVGDLLIRLDESTAALAHFRRAARSLEDSGFRTKAIATLRKAYRQAEEDVDIAIDLAGLLKREGLAADARSVLFELAFKREKLGDIRGAKKIYYQVLEIDSHHIQTLIKIGEIAEREGDSAEEARIYTRIIRTLAQSARYEEAVDMLDNLDSRFQDNKEINKLKVDVFVRVGREKEALKLLKGMQSEFPEDPELLISMAQVALRTGNIEQAEKLYDKLTGLSEPTEETDLLGAGILISKSSYEEALKKLQPHIDEILEETKEGPAIIAIEEIVKRDASYVPALKKLKQIYTYLKDKENLVRILITLSKAYEQDNDYRLAIDEVEQLIGLEPDKLSHKNRLEHLYELSGGAAMFENEGVTVENLDLPDSLDFSLEDEVSSEGLDPAVHRHLVEASVFLKYGMTKKAREQLLKALDVDEYEPRLYEKLGETYLEEQENAKAIEAYEKAKDCWQRRNDSEKAAEMDGVLDEISTGKDPRADVVLSETEFDSDEISLEFVDEEDEAAEATVERADEEESQDWVGGSDPLQGKLAEAEYYIEQNFITAAQHLLDKLQEQYPNNSRVEALKNSLENKLKSEMDITNMEKDLDDFFSSHDETPKAAPEQPAPPVDKDESSALKDMINLLEDDISEIGSLADKKANQMDTLGGQPMQGLISHTEDDEYLRTALQEDAGKHYDMGIAYYETELFDEAIQSFKIAVKNPRFYQKSCLQLGLCYLGKGMENVAITWLQKCFTGGGDEGLMADSLHQMAIIYQLQGQQRAFVNAVEQLNSLDPDYPGLKTLNSLVASQDD